MTEVEQESKNEQQPQDDHTRGAACKHYTQFIKLCLLYSKISNIQRLLYLHCTILAQSTVIFLLQLNPLLSFSWSTGIAYKWAFCLHPYSPSSRQHPETSWKSVNQTPFLPFLILPKAFRIKSQLFTITFWAPPPHNMAPEYLLTPSSVSLTTSSHTDSLYILSICPVHFQFRAFAQFLAISHHSSLRSQLICYFLRKKFLINLSKAVTEIMF